MRFGRKLGVSRLMCIVATGQLTIPDKVTRIHLRNLTGRKLELRLNISEISMPDLTFICKQVIFRDSFGENLI